MASGGHIELVRVKRTHPTLLEMMPRHYSAPKGFVGRNLCYLIQWHGWQPDVPPVTYGAIVGGSATRFLPGREAFFGAKLPLNSLVNNTFFHVEPGEQGYPCRNFVSRVIATWRARMLIDWPEVCDAAFAASGHPGPFAVWHADGCVAESDDGHTDGCASRESAEAYFSWSCGLPGWGHFGADMLDYVVIYPEGKP